MSKLTKPLFFLLLCMNKYIDHVLIADTMSIIILDLLRGNVRNRYRRAGKCVATVAAASTTWTTTHARPPGSGRTLSDSLGFSIGEASADMWSRRAISDSYIRRLNSGHRLRPIAKRRPLVRYHLFKFKIKIVY